MAGHWLALSAVSTTTGLSVVLKGHMQVLITGHHGYIGSVMAGVLARAGHDVTGLDIDLYEGCTFGEEPLVVPSMRKDVRDVTVGDLRGFEAVIHLAALSNDPLGCLNERSTEINHLASVRLATHSRRSLGGDCGGHLALCTASRVASHS